MNFGPARQKHGLESGEFGPKKQRLDRDRRVLRVQPLPDDDQQEGQVAVVDYRRSYGFVDMLTIYDAPVRVNRAHRGSPYFAFGAPQRVHVVFDCISAPWFDRNVPDNLNVAWDTVAAASQSFRAEIDVPVALYQLLNQRLHPVTGLLMPAIDEGTWWMLKIPLAPTGNFSVPALLTLPQSNNPVSTILSGNQFVAPLEDLTIPRKLMKLRRFSHGWALGFPPADLPPYPGR